MAKKDITGQKFGKLTAIKAVRSDKASEVIWQCQCDCGCEKEIPVSRLTSGITRNCGCLTQEHSRRKDIAGQRFGFSVRLAFFGCRG